MMYSENKLLQSVRDEVNRAGDTIRDYVKFLELILEIKKDPALDSVSRDCKIEVVRQNIIDRFSVALGDNLRSRIDKDLIKLENDLYRIKDKDDDQELVSLKDLAKSMGKSDISENWLVLGWIGLGAMYFIAASAKSGKTDIVFSLMRSIASGSPWLNSPVKQGTVIYCGLEENNNSMEVKMMNHGYAYSDFLDAKGDILLKRQLDLETDIPYLEYLIEKHKPVLVVIDTARAALINSTVSEVKAEWADPFRKLHMVSIRRNVTFIITHHLNKRSSKEDPLDRFSGTSASGGIGEGTFVFDRIDDEEPGCIRWQAVTRDLGRRTFIIQRNKNYATRQVTYTVKEEVGIDPEITRASKQIIHILLNGECSFSKLEEYMQDRHVLDAAIDRLLGSCHIKFKPDESKKEAIYYIPESIKKYLFTMEEYANVHKHSDIANVLLACKSKEEVFRILKSYPKEDLNNALSVMPYKEKYDLAKTIDPPKMYEGYTPYKFNWDICNPEWQYLKLSDGSLINGSRLFQLESMRNQCAPSPEASLEIT